MYIDFLKKYLLFSVLVALVVILPSVFLVDNHLVWGISLNLLVFFVLVFVSSIILLNAVNKNSQNFQTYTLGAIFAKMILAVVYFYFIFGLYKNNLLIFVGSFFLSYLLFTIFEVSFLVRFLRKKTDK
jgi:ABC-type uncharacterized transport system permease subunit